MDQVKTVNGLGRRDGRVCVLPVTLDRLGEPGEVLVQSSVYWKKQRIHVGDLLIIPGR